MTDSQPQFAPTRPEVDALSSVAWPVRTSRLLLRRATPSDTAATWRFRQLPLRHLK